MLRLLLALLALPLFAAADIVPEEITVAKMAKPTDTWLLAKSTFGPAYVFDAESGDMHGLLSVSEWTPALAIDERRRKIYAAESYYTRRHRGERSDMLTIYDLETLTPEVEIPLPNKLAALSFRQYIGMLSDRRHVAVFNMDPGQSISIVDVRDREFVGEVSIAGCALIMPVDDRGFLSLCGDGSAQLIRLNRRGEETLRVRSEAFFDVEEDPVFDRPVRTANGWLLVSFENLVYELTVADGAISVSEPWSITTDEEKEEKWRVGGYQVLEYHIELGLMFTLMHQGKEDTHEELGTEVWISALDKQRKIATIKLPAKGSNLLVSQGDEALLTVTGEDNKLHVFDVEKAKLHRTIEQVGTYPSLLQGFAGR